VLGVVENMSDIRIPFESLASSSTSGISLVNKQGDDVTAAMLERYVHTLRVSSIALCKTHAFP
jgi:DNA-binding ferritin-like protein